MSSSSSSSSSSVLQDAPAAAPPPSTTAALSVDEIYALVHSRRTHEATLPSVALAAMMLFGVPAMVAVLPFSMLYQMGKTIAKQVVAAGSTSSATSHSLLTPMDSGLQVPDEDIIPFQDRNYDLVVLGATGFTGSLCVRHLAKTYGVSKNNNNNSGSNNNSQGNIKWAIAGRSQSKLNEVKKRWAVELDNEDIMNIDTILVDTSDPSTLPGLVRNTRAVATTAGPFEQYGSPVVEFCAKYGTHYADITGEIHWSKHMTIAWEETAKRTGAKIVSLCGSDSIPWDLSTMAMEDALPEGETLKKVTFIDDGVGEFSGGTVATGMLSIMGRSRGTPSMEFDPFLRLLDGSRSVLKFTNSPVVFPKKLTQPSVVSGLYGAFFVMAPINAEAVKKGVAQRQRATELTYCEYLRMPDWKSAVALTFALPFAVVMLFNPITKYVLDTFLPNPGEGPTMLNMEQNYFGCTIGYGEGTNGTTVETVMYFPQDQGYLHTARMVVESGLCLAVGGGGVKQQQSGGFFAPSTGMGQPLLQRLRETGTYFGIKVTPTPCSTK